MKKMYFRGYQENLGSSNVAEYIINSADQSNTGTYSCKARNSAGSAEDRVQLIVTEDANDIPSGENEEPTEENRTTGPSRGDISGNDEYGNVIPSAKPEEDLVNKVGSRAELTCNAGKSNKLSARLFLC